MLEGVAGRVPKTTRPGVLARTRSPVSRRRLPYAALLLTWGVASGCLALFFSGRIRDWGVMTDELQYAKLATAIADTGSPFPQLHETSVSALSQLYPLSIAPFYGLLSGPDAFRAAHVFNAFLMTSAVLPAYLLGRQVLSRSWAFACALLAVLVPWMVLMGFLMTEVVAYPAFLWAVLGLHRAVAHPSSQRDLLAIGALLLAFLARTQFAVLVLVLPLAILVHEVGRAFVDRRPGSASTKLGRGVREARRRHTLLVGVYALGAAAVVVLGLAGLLGKLLGSYAVTVDDGSILPWGTWEAAARRIDAVGVGCGLVPLLLGGGWMLAATIRPRTDAERALASVSLLTVVMLTLEVASFDLRFGDDIVRDRYLFYLVPLLLVGSGAALGSPSRRLVAGCVALVTAFFAATVPLLEFPIFGGLSVDSPPRILNEPLRDWSGDLGVSTGMAVAVGGVVLGVLLTLGVLFARRVPLALVLFCALFAFSIGMLRAEVGRVVGGTSLAGRPLAGSPGRMLDWVDTVLPPDARAAIVPFPLSTSWDSSALGWWDLEFWNRSVTRTYVAADGNFTYTPFPSRHAALDWETGRIRDTADAPAYVVAAAHDPRFRLAGTRRAERLGFRVIAAERPYRAAWATQGLQADGWTLPDRPATLRVYGAGSRRSALVHVELTLLAPHSPARYWLSTGELTSEGSVEPGTARNVELPLCVPKGSYAQVILLGWSSARIGGPPLSPQPQPRRRVGVGLTAVEVSTAGQGCDRVRS